MNDVGFVTFAINTEDTDYLELAYQQALNCKRTNPTFGYSVIVDDNTAELVEAKHKKVFDQIVYIDLAYKNPMSNEWLVYFLSPYNETIKLESDLLFTRSIEHWLDMFRLRSVVLSSGCKDYFGNTSDVRFYRKFFDDNNLPDVYNGLMYFRKDNTAEEFFTVAGEIVRHWDEIKDTVLKNCREEYLSTDVIYSVAAEVFGRERCTIPSADFINFVHMKIKIQRWTVDEQWVDGIFTELDENMIRINNLNQYYPVHYYDKQFVKRLEEHYELR